MLWMVSPSAQDASATIRIFAGISSLISSCAELADQRHDTAQPRFRFPQPARFPAPVVSAYQTPLFTMIIVMGVRDSSQTVMHGVRRSQTTAFKANATQIGVRFNHAFQRRVTTCCSAASIAFRLLPAACCSTVQPVPAPPAYTYHPPLWSHRYESKHALQTVASASPIPAANRRAGAPATILVSTMTIFGLFGSSR